MNGKAARASRAGVILACALGAEAVLAQTDIAIVTDQSLGFGQIVATGSSGSVTVTPGGLRSASGGALLGSSLNVSAASFTVTGEVGRTYAISMPGSVTLSGGASSMTVTGFSSTPSETGVLGTAGSETVFVGATLEVGAAQPAGTYSGSFTVTVTYN